jgi:hypothetical protein
VRMLLAREDLGNPSVFDEHVGRLRLMLVD